MTGMKNSGIIGGRCRNGLGNQKGYNTGKIYFLLFVLLILNGVRPIDGGRFGALHLCPAGGRSFMVAWNLACEMKRKKRESGLENGFKPSQEKKAPAPDGYRPATLSDIMHICCDMGCDIRDLLAYCDPFGSWNS